MSEKKSAPGTPPEKCGRRDGKPVRRHQSPPPKTGRAVALACVLACRRKGSSTSDALPQACERARLSGAERNLARELAGGQVRHAVSLDAAIATASNRKPETLDEPLLEVLRQGAYQLLFLERIAAYAAIDESVKLAKTCCGRSTGALANAVLRRLSRSVAPPRSWEAGKHPHDGIYFRGGRCAFLRTAFVPDHASDPVGWLSIFYGYPRDVVEVLRESLAEPDAEKVLAAGNEIPPVVARINRTLVDSSRDDPVKVFAGAMGCSPVDEKGAADGLYVLAGASDIGSMPGYRAGLWTIQDPWAARAVLRLDLPKTPGFRAVDLCAAPGGKATALAERLAGTGEVLACDVDPARLARVSEHAARMKLANLAVRAVDGRSPPGDLRGIADLVLVDAPCTNLGVMGRRWEVRHRADREAVARMAKLQGELLDGAARVLKPRGRIVYSTCTLTREENAGAVAAFLARHGEFRRVREDTQVPVGGEHDGGYVCEVER